MPNLQNLPTPLVRLDRVLRSLELDLEQRGLRLDPVYSWTDVDLAEMLLDLDEQVFKSGNTYLVTEAVAEKLKAFAEDFVTDKA